MSTPPTQVAQQQFKPQGSGAFDFEEFRKRFGQGQGQPQFGPQAGGFQGFQQGGGFPGFGQQGSQRFQFGQGSQSPQFSGGFPGGFQQFSQQRPAGSQTPAPGGPGSQQAPQGGPGALAPGAGLSRNVLNQGGFLGGAGNVRFDPATGQEIPLGDRVSPNQFINRQFNEQSRGLVQGPAIQEAQGFQFDVPDSGVQGLLPGLTGAAQGLLGGGQNALSQGQGFAQSGANALLGNIGAAGAGATGAGGDRAAAISQLNELQQRALSPNIDPQQRQFLQQMADQERAAINARFAQGGDIANQFERQNAADVAQLAAKGVLDSQTGANVIGRRQADLGATAANLLGQADQAANQRLIDEQNRITGAATAFGGVQGQQATAGGGLMADLLKTQAGAGSALGGLGTTQQGIGAQLSGLGLQGLNQAGQLGLADQGQQADLQQAALSTRLMGNQLGLQNIQSLLNQQLGRQATRQELEQARMLFEQQQGGGGGFFDNPFVNALSPITNFF